MSEESPRGLSRRTMVTSVAWGVPVITLAIASPAAAASAVNPSISSTGLPSGYSFGTTAGKPNYPDDGGAIFDFNLVNDGAEAILAGATIVVSITSSLGTDHFGTPTSQGMGVLVSAATGTISIATDADLPVGDMYPVEVSIPVDSVPVEGLLSHVSASVMLVGQTDAHPSSGFLIGPDFYFINRTTTDALAVSVSLPVGAAAIGIYNDLPVYATDQYYTFEAVYKNNGNSEQMSGAVVFFDFPSGFSDWSYATDVPTFDYSGGSGNKAIRLTDPVGMAPGAVAIFQFTAKLDVAPISDPFGPLYGVAGISVQGQEDSDFTNDAVQGLPFYGQNL
jgi:hypothetical protein